MTLYGDKQHLLECQSLPFLEINAARLCIRKLIKGIVGLVGKPVVIEVRQQG